MFDHLDDHTDSAGTLPALVPGNAVSEHEATAGLLEQHADMKARVQRLGYIVKTEQTAAGFFLTGNTDRRERYCRAVAELFDVDGALAALDAHYWRQALERTGVYELMPQKRRDEWNDAIHECKTPPFTAEHVLPTIQNLLLMRETYFAERVDGIFRGLSGAHVTNSPAAFGKRMIVAGVITGFGSTCCTKAGLIHDLRGVMARFLGYEEPTWRGSMGPLEIGYRKRPGEWLTVDGGAMRIRVYKKGTAHVEIHEDMAWRLNAVLAMLYPLAIPPAHRTQPAARKGRVVEPIQRPLPRVVINAINGGRRDGRSFYLSFDVSREVRREATGILEALGAVSGDGGRRFEFDYNPDDALDWLVTAGTMPEVRSHQFYPTPPEFAAEVVRLAQIEPEHSCLEPSAGQGGLAEWLPVDRTQCVELSGLHCSVLRGKGLAVEQADFLVWAQTAPLFDRIVMNPPFTGGQGRNHVEVAAGLVRPGGRLVAILPASMRGADLLGDDFECEWGELREGLFKGASVVVTTLVADRKQCNT